MSGGSRRQRLQDKLREDATAAKKHIPLHDGERIIEHQFAKTPETGGELALTDQRLVFAPWRFTALREVLAAGFWPVPPDPALPEAIQHVQLLSGTVMIPIEKISGASSGRKATFYRPPGIHITTPDGTVEFGILVSPYKRNRSPSNARARDAFIASINRAIG